MRTLLIVGLLAATVAGCQTRQESLVDAQITCESQGFRPGTKAYQQCQSANYVENRRANSEASAAVATGVAAGVIGGALVGAAASRPYYGRRGYYYGPGYYY